MQGVNVSQHVQTKGNIQTEDAINQDSIVEVGSVLIHTYSELWKKVVYYHKFPQ